MKHQKLNPVRNQRFFNGVNKGIIFSISLLILGFAFTGAAFAQGGQIEFIKQRITTDSAYQGNPAIYGSYIVYRDTRNGNSDIYMYDLATDIESRITTDASNQTYPNIYGNYIVWLDMRNGGLDVYGYDLSTKTERRISSYTNKFYMGNQRPGIYGDKVVYYDNRTGNGDIWMYDLTTGLETQITTNSANQYDPDIYGDKIVWWDFRDSGKLNVYMYDLSTGIESRISNSIYNGFQGRRVSIYDNYIVWDDERNGNPNIDIFMYDLSTNTESPVSTNLAMQWGPDVSGNYAVWTDQRRGGTSSNYETDIYMYDISTGIEYPVATGNTNPGGYDAWGASMDGNRIVWSDYGTGNGDIYMATIVPANIPPVANTGPDQTVHVGSIVTLDGSGSLDANRDTLNYKWMLSSVPEGSLSVIANPTAMITSFVPDLPGTYVVQLIVNDGFVNSNPSTIQIQAVTSVTLVIESVQTAETKIVSLEPFVFKNENMQNALLNKLNAVIANIEAGNYEDALGQLQNDILVKTDGCAKSGAPDKNDWIKDCESQGIIYPYILDVISKVKELL